MASCWERWANSFKEALRSRLVSRASSSAFMHSRKRMGLPAMVSSISLRRWRTTLLASMMAMFPSSCRKDLARSRFSRSHFSLNCTPCGFWGEKNFGEEEFPWESRRRSSPLLKTRTLRSSSSRVRAILRAMVDLPRAGSPTRTMTSFACMGQLRIDCLKRGGDESGLLKYYKLLSVLYQLSAGSC